MGVSSAALARESSARVQSSLAGGLTAWLCGVFAIALAAAMIALLARAGWADIATETVNGSQIIPSLEWSLALISLALPLAALVAIGAAVAAAEPALGGRAGRLLNVALRAGPAVPGIVIGIAALAIVTADAQIANAARLHPVLSAALALAALNLPIMSARLRTVFRGVPLVWRVAAAASGATPGVAFARIVMPRAWPGIVAVLLNTAGQMLGETAVIAIVLFATNRAQPPLPVYLWEMVTHGAGPGSTGPVAAAEALVLVVAIAALRLTSRALLGSRRRPQGAPA